MNNPFQLTRAADLNDEQIMNLWVDPEGELGTRLRPASELPMIILGGKGSGKTHLMRYYSYAIQHLQHGRSNMQKRVAEAKYIGIYARCSGLNAARFSRKRHNDEQWHALFAFHTELWFGQLILQTASEFIIDSSASSTYDERALVEELCKLFDTNPGANVITLDDFSGYLKKLQNELDRAVNNAGFGRSIEPNIIVTPGRLIFGIPQTLSRLVSCFKGILFTLFIDEYENLYEHAQRYVNTLVRERENPVTFKIGARLYGIRTYKTFSGSEELHEGSEYEVLNLDQALRNKAEAYEQFALKLCVSRVRFSLNDMLPNGWTDEKAVKNLQDCFEPSLPVEERVRKKFEGRTGDSPWLNTLNKALSTFQNNVLPLGITDENDINAIIDYLRFESNPLIEKTNVFLFYRAWSKRVKLMEASIGISESAKQFAQSQDKQTDHWRVLDKFKEDLRAQMLHELDLHELELPQNYVGLLTWIRMSNGIVRNLITTLKHVFDWASFHNEDTFALHGISLRSQVKGVRDASNWFINDAMVLGSDRGVVMGGVNRIASLMRALRFSEKPPECSLSTFSVDSNSLDEALRKNLETAEHWSLLIRTADRTERNTEMEVIKYRVNGMITPKFDLPIYTRGSIHLTTAEASVIFGNSDEVEFARMQRVRLARVQPPFSSKNETAVNEPPDELTLF